MDSNEWNNVARYAQAKCADNGGFAVVKLKIVVHKNVPMLWNAELEAYCPMKAGHQFNAKILAALSALVDT